MIFDIKRFSKTKNAEGSSGKTQHALEMRLAMIANNKVTVRAFLLLMATIHNFESKCRSSHQL
jgi:hypothetical protein